MPTEIREVLMDRDELLRLVGMLVASGDAAKLCSIPAGAVPIDVDTWGRTTYGDKVRIALYSIEVPGPDPTWSVGIGDSGANNDAPDVVHVTCARITSPHAAP